MFHVVGPEETLILVELTMTVEGIELGWQATPGKSYQVDSKQSLTDPAWLPAGAPLKVETERGSINFPRPGPPFFRVRQLD